MIAFEDIDNRLTSIGKDRKWLVEITKRSEGAIRSALAPNSLPKNRSALLQKALSDAIEQEEAQRILQSPSLNGIYEIRQSKEQAERTDRASRAVGSDSLSDFCLKAIMYRTDEILDQNIDPCGKSNRQASVPTSPADKAKSSISRAV